MMTTDLDVLKDIPGYKAILKSVLKSQVQLLLEQLSEQTGEESIILTASITDGALSHLGSNTGKGFLEGRDDLKSQFLGYCLKTFHKQKTEEPKPQLQRRSHPRPRLQSRPHPHYQPPSKHPRLHPVALKRASTGNLVGLPGSLQSRTPNLPSHYTHDNVENEPSVSEDKNSSSINEVTEQAVKIEKQTSHDSDEGNDIEKSEKVLEKSTSHENLSDSVNDQTTSNEEANIQNQQADEINLESSNIKIEPITEHEMELEITAVEPGNVSHPTMEDWSPSFMGSGHSSGLNESSYLDQSGDHLGYGLTNSQILTSYPTSFHAPIKLSTACSPPTGDSQFSLQCPTCHREFRTRQNLSRHMMIHTGEKPHPCDFCDKSFRMRHHLVGHVRTIHHGLLE